MAGQFTRLTLPRIDDLEVHALPVTAYGVSLPNPAFRARMMASARSATCNFPKIFETWFRTVLGLSTRRSAMAVFVYPCAISSRISRSRALSSGKVAAGWLRPAVAVCAGLSCWWLAK